MMLKTILTFGAAAVCLALPATAESYVRGDGCAGTYVNRSSDMMVGNITGGTRYKCRPVRNQEKPGTAPITQRYTPTRSYTTNQNSYVSSGQTTRTYYSAPQSHSGTTYFYAQPSTSYQSSGAYVTHPPHSTYTYSEGYDAPGSAYRQSGHSYVPYDSGSYYRTTPPRTTYTTTPQVTYTQPYQTTGPNAHYTVHGTPRVTGNLANSYTTTVDEGTDEFDLSKPETYTNTAPK